MTACQKEAKLAKDLAAALEEFAAELAVVYARQAALKARDELLSARNRNINAQNDAIRVLFNELCAEREVLQEMRKKGLEQVDQINAAFDAGFGGDPSESLEAAVGAWSERIEASVAVTQNHKALYTTRRENYNIQLNGYRSTLKAQREELKGIQADHLARLTDAFGAGLERLAGLGKNRGELKSKMAAVLDTERGWQPTPESDAARPFR